MVIVAVQQDTVNAATMLLLYSIKLNKQTNMA